LTNGTEIQGMLSRVEGGKLYLNEQPGAGRTDNVTLKKPKITKKIGAAKKASAIKNAPAFDFAPPFYGPNPSPYDGIDLSAVAALFVLV
jgi:hypothetical protein